jgi:hypothetical protein
LAAEETTVAVPGEPRTFLRLKCAILRVIIKNTITADGMDVKTAIGTGDAEALKLLLSADPSRANALIRWGKNDCIFTHPLHYVSDMLFEGKLKRGNELPLIAVLIDAGADLDFQREREDGKKGDTPLIGAASLGAEEVGLKLLHAGGEARVTRTLWGDSAPLGRLAWRGPPNGGSY